MICAVSWDNLLSAYEQRHNKTGLWGFQPCPTQTGLYSHRRWLEALNFRLRNQRDATWSFWPSSCLFNLKLKVSVVSYGHMGRHLKFCRTFPKDLDETRDDVYETLCPQQLFVPQDTQIHKYQFIKQNCNVSFWGRQIYGKSHQLFYMYFVVIYSPSSISWPNFKSAA